MRVKQFDRDINDSDQNEDASDDEGMNGSDKDTGEPSEDMATSDADVGF